MIRPVFWALPLLLSASWSADSFLSDMRKADSRDEPEEKIVYYSRAISAWSASHGNSLLGHCHFGRGQAYYAQGQFDLGAPDLSKAIQFDPGNARAYFLRGKILFKTGKYAEAARDFFDFSSAGESPEGYWNLGAAYEKAGRRVDAAKAYRRAAQMAPDDFHPPLGLAGILISQKKWAQALEHLERAAGPAKNRSPEVLTQAGRCRAALGSPAGALADFEAAIALYEKKLTALERSKAAPVEISEIKEGLAEAYLERSNLPEQKPPAPKPKKKYRKIQSEPGERIYGG